MCLGNASKGFTVDNMKKTRLDWYVSDFFVNYNTCDASHIVDICKYLMKSHKIK